MAEYTSKTLEVVPYFDIELLMSVSQETRIDGTTMDKLAKLWEKWGQNVNARHLKVGRIQYLAVWLGEDVEQEVDAAWDDSPSEAYLLGNLAQVLVMCSVNKLLPEVEEAGCAPAPRPTDSLVEALEEEGCPYNNNATALERRFAVVTHYPFKGACDICYLQNECPKGAGMSQEASSFVLPGYEADK